MIKIIAGKKGKGKTKHLLDMVNTEVKNVHGNIVYLDKSGKHMYELNNKVRLIDMSEYDLKDTSEFIGFIYGIISQDNDLEQIYAICRDSPPPGYQGYRMALSDVVELYDDSGSEFFYCDRVGFRPIQFDQRQEQNECHEMTM